MAVAQRKLARALYAGLLRAGRLYDKEPVLKAMLVGLENKVYMHETGVWEDTHKSHPGTPETELGSAVTAFMGGREYYHPSRSLESFIRDYRASPPPLKVRAKGPRPLAAVAKAREDLGFAALHMLNEIASACHRGINHRSEGRQQA
eukprot:CAMPEP_0182870480 /NCGR_PEP_ID=MMETSP0034_2-20130328/10552_1 /TAXON_ID=156128 /ORGANISM="Nephroselmis pyriformis, Strain CCMP717" /LENGTH=146 /DNA_ID=CAMNT_0025002977 /DNA_START=84 /DNA_END=520 /DNA_ORIENTATION=+